MTGTAAEAWHAPYAGVPVRGTVRVPGSKSVTNRALVLATLADAPSRLTRPLRSRDTDLMAGALRALGTDVTETDDGWLVSPGELRGPAAIDVGLAGTVMRFVPPIATLATGPIGLDGDARARERPIAALIDALRALGATIEDDGRGGLPFTVHGGGGLTGGDVEIDASASSQLVSALLLTGARWARGCRVVHVGDRPVPNAPHLRMTAAMLRARGVDVDAEASRWTVTAGRIAGRDETVEPDLSSAAPFFAAAVVTAGSVGVDDWPVDSAQPGANLPALLGAFGATARREGRALVVDGPPAISGVDLDLRDAGELVPVLAAVAAVATGPSTFSGVGYLRGHETDRLRALATELSRLGAKVEELDDGLRIHPGPMHGEVFQTYDDHRLAMAAAVLGLVVPDLVVADVATTAKTYPQFADDWTRLVTGAGH